MSAPDKPVPGRVALARRHFLSLFLPLALFVIMGAWAYLHADSQVRREAIVAREMARVSREAEVFTSVIEARATDAAFLAAHITDMLQDPGTALHDRIFRLLWSFAARKQWYVQVRFLDARERSPSGWISAPMDPRAYRSMDSKTNRERPIFVWVPERPSGRSTSPSSI
jgi:hypothetical protein